MTETEHYKLKQPEGGDYIGPEAFNENAAVIDGALHGLETGKAGLDPATGKVRPEQLPKMDYDPAGSSAEVDRKLGDHIGRSDNPHQVTADQVGAIPAGAKGAAGGVAELDEAGKVLAGQLPSYVDDVLEYANLSSFPTPGESGKIYVAQDSNKTYRWSGSGYVEISQGITLGETSATAYRGDRGKVAYDHTMDQTRHVTAAERTAWNGKAVKMGPVVVTVAVESWAGTGPWTQTVSVAGVTGLDNHIGVYPVDVDDPDARKLYEKAYGCLAAEAETVDGGVKLTCREACPETAFQIKVQGVR